MIPAQSPGEGHHYYIEVSGIIDILPPNDTGVLDARNDLLFWASTFFWSPATPAIVPVLAIWTVCLLVCQTHREPIDQGRKPIH